MKHAEIAVEIRQPNGENSIRVLSPIPELTIEQCFQVIKRNSYDFADMNTSAALEMKIRSDREKAAKILSETITNHIISIFESKDLFNGYTKDEQKRFTGD